MSMMDDWGQPYDLPASASPGLAPLPGGSDEPAPAMAPVEGPSSFAPPPAMPQPAMTPPPATSGLGMADFKKGRSDDERAYLESLPTSQKIGLMMQSFASGVNGGPNPVEALLENKRRREAEFRAELGTTVKTIHEGMAIVSKMAPGKGRDALIEQIARTAGGNGGEVRAALLAVGTEAEAAVRQSVSMLDNPAAQKYLTEASGGDAGKARELLKDKDFMDRLEKRFDAAALPNVTAKVRVITQAMAKLPDQAKDEAGNPIFTMADLREQNAKLPKEFQLTDGELGAAQRNQAALIAYGMKTDKTSQDEQSANAKRKEEGPLSEIAKLNRDLAEKRITREQWSMGMRKVNLGAEKQDQKTADKATATATTQDTALSPEAIEDAAHRYNLDGTLPPNLGRGTQGSLNSAKILTKAAALARESGDSGEETRIRQVANKASAQALGQLEKQKNLVLAFEKNAVKNADIVLEEAAKVDKLGSPIIDRWILAGKKNVAGDPGVAKLDAAVRTFVNEYARVTTSVTGGGVTSDHARKEIDDLLKAASSPEQIVEVVNLMKREMGNRKTAYDDQISELKAGMGSKPKAAAEASAGATTPAAGAQPAASAVPAGIPPGSKPVGYAKDGKRVWQDPSGKKWKE